MKLEIFFNHIDKKKNVTLIGKNASYSFPKNFETLPKEEQEKLLYKFLGTNIANITKKDIEDSCDVSIQVCIDLSFEDDRETKLGGCSISGATIHATRVSITNMAIAQLVRQIMNTLEEGK